MSKENNWSFKSFDILLHDIHNLADSVPNLKEYLAHTPSSSIAQYPEPLQDHISLVNQTALKLIKIHSLEKVVNRLIREVCVFLNIDSEVEVNFIKEIFLASIVFHDFGKLNENFQYERMKNELFQKVDLQIGSHHSILSAYLFLNHYLEKLEQLQSERKNALAGIICAFADPILKHHSSALQVSDLDMEQCQQLNRFLPFIGMKLPATFWPAILNNKLKAVQNIFLNIQDLHSFPHFTLLKLNFSLLTAADYLATFSYQYNYPLPEVDDLDWWGVMSESLKTTLYKKFKASNLYNNDSLENPEKLSEISFHALMKRNSKNLNSLRSKMLGEAIVQLRKNHNKKLFYLKAPTGGGKTNISLAVALESLQQDTCLNKVFYVFPFTTLITQTYKTIKETLELDDDFILQLHSKAEWSNKKAEENKDGLYSNEWINHLDNLFAQYPIILLSHVRFFDILKGNHKEMNYLLHRLANSVVVIDELQSYSSRFWDHVSYFITHYSESFNIRFVLMSATLPEVGKLALSSDNEWVNLLVNQSEYFQNPNFAKRIQFNYSLLEEGLAGTQEEKLNQLVDFIALQSESYANDNGFCVRAIVEFITKKSAANFFKLSTSHPILKNYEVLLLTGTILEPRRRQITDWLKCQKWQEEHSKVLLVSTQVVEAGVDIDMDIGFKDTSLLDSDEQLAGRVNRNAGKNNNCVFLFDLDQEDQVYRKEDERLRIQNTEMTSDEKREILSNKEFNRLYDLIIKKHIENRSQLIRNFDSYLEHLKYLRFYEASQEFQLIDEKTVAIFIPLSITINEFSDQEKELLGKMKVMAEPEDNISGQKLFEAYEGLIHNKSDDFIKRRDAFRQIQSLMSKFTISVYPQVARLIEILEQESGQSDPYHYGYLYCSAHEIYYEYEIGLTYSSIESGIDKGKVLSF
jgi:CRISPR-associated endonuclease/helicase Cas3